MSWIPPHLLKSFVIQTALVITSAMVIQVSIAPYLKVFIFVLGIAVLKAEAYTVNFMMSLVLYWRKDSVCHVSSVNSCQLMWVKPNAKNICLQSFPMQPLKNMLFSCSHLLSHSQSRQTIKLVAVSCFTVFKPRLRQ